MRGGIWVLNFFAALWVVAAILFAHQPAWLVIIPVAISAALLWWASRQPVGTGNPARSAYVGRVVGLATGIELVAMIVAANLLVAWHQPSAVIPVAIIIVGLHFLPLARWVPVPLYYRTAAGLMAVGAAALCLPPPYRAIAGVAAALVLWESAIALTVRGRR